LNIKKHLALADFIIVLPGAARKADESAGHYNDFPRPSALFFKPRRLVKFRILSGCIADLTFLIFFRAGHALHSVRRSKFSYSCVLSVLRVVLENHFMSGYDNREYG
jgi:hypothetical protein